MTTDVEPLRNYVGNLTDFVYGVDADNHLDIEVAVNELGKVVIFHNRVFKNDIGWFEFELATNRLNFIMDDGEIRDAGMALTPQMAKNMHNSHQILMVLIDPETGDAKEGHYVPLIIHQKD